MLYVVKQGDTLSEIARKVGSTIPRIMAANVICNPSLIFPGQLLLLPENGMELPKAGGYPYYIVQYGDTLWCLANQFSQSIQSIAKANQLENANVLFAGSELLVSFDPHDPQELAYEWSRMGGVACEEMSSLQIHGVYYLGSFRWEALGESAVPFLLPFLTHSCETVRYYTVLSLGRIATGTQTIFALQQALNDQSPEIVELAQLSLNRTKLIPTWSKRIHLVTRDVQLLQQPNLQSPTRPLSKGTPIRVLRWNIPSPTGEEGPRGDIQIYDFVQVLGTGENGLIPRVGFNEILLV
jgi:LysM repeat protein